jgi:Protein of unknown function (DUF1161)
MKKALVAGALLLFTAAPALAEQKSCAELAAEIAANLEAKGVKGYRLDIVNAGEAGKKQVVGSCENGAKRITYTKVETKSPS